MERCRFGGGCGFWSQFLVQAARGQSDGEIWTAGFANGFMEGLTSEISNHAIWQRRRHLTTQKGVRFLGLEYSFGGLKTEGWCFHVQEFEP
ncbi:hypothetical protein OROMI_017991 [Orobanche minor]